MTTILFSIIMAIASLAIIGLAVRQLRRIKLQQEVIGLEIQRLHEENSHE